MSDNKENVPKIRFPGFTDAWEQRSLSELGNLNRGKSKHRPRNDKRLYGGKYPFVQTGDVASAGLYIDAYTQTYNEFGIQQSKLWNEDTLLITIAANIAETTILKIKAAFPDSIIGFETIENNVVFIKFALDRISDNLRSKAETSSQANLNLAKLSNIDFYIPSRMEQDLVSKFFKQLEHLITLHQRKLHNAKNLKAGLFQKMFPKDGEDFPEVRFPGFTDAWEQRELGDVSERVRGNDGRMDLPTLTISAGNGWLDQRERFSGNIAGNEQKNYTLLTKGELSYNHGNSKLAKYGAVFVLKSYEEALVPRVYHSFRVTKEASADFIEYMFLTKIPDKELAKLISSGARMDGLLNINYDDFMSIKITIPKVEEQIKIAEFFRIVDHLITLHQRKLERLQEQKKALLQQMFV
ncbi:restriction endonuclease subunit S [Paenibacillus camerounensis]|uniref:restriction endonuclease subunit S n=1 Tax=Paenibacillus camerounensis TaxID=1243663 RepID=UPI0005A6500D|nr:restriction endonuclease subunit S [Paenibacillus camerounensis]